MRHLMMPTMSLWRKMEPCPKDVGRNVKPTLKHIEKVNWNDKVFQGMLGLREFPNPATPRILFTSRPVLFSRPTVRTIDVVDGTPRICQTLEAFQTFGTISFVIGYDNQDDLGKHPLSHGSLLTEAGLLRGVRRSVVECCGFLRTRRWDQYAIQEPPIICSGTIGLTASDVAIELAVTNWAEGTDENDDSDKSYHELFTYGWFEVIMQLGEEYRLQSMTRNAFPADMLEEMPEQERTKLRPMRASRRETTPNA